MGGEFVTAHARTGAGKRKASVGSSGRSSNPIDRQVGSRPSPDPTTVCRCKEGPLIIATFRKETLVAVERRHWRKDGCRLPTEHVDPGDYGVNPGQGNYLRPIERPSMKRQR